MSAEQRRLPAALTAVAVRPTHGGNHHEANTAVTSRPGDPLPLANPAPSPGDGAAAAATPTLTLEGVRVSFGDHVAVRDVTLAIPSREVTALIGPSGCGKTTLLRAINRLHDHTGGRVEGSIKLGDLDLYAASTRPELVRTRIGMVFQRPNPFPKSIFDNVAYGLRVNGLKGKQSLGDQVEHSLKRAALWDEVKDKLNQSAYSLSGGQQQRLCIARALAVDPEVLLLDEPCSALDPIATSKIEDLLFTLKDQCTQVIVTHNMQQAARVAEFTGFFLLGKLIEFDKTEIIFKRPERKETEDYITGRFG